MWPIFFQKSLILGDVKRNVGICTLWSKKEFFADKVPGHQYCAIGNLYTADGINYILKNILANPVINHLVVCGADFFKSGEALINFFKNGIDENRQIIGSNAYLHSNISLDVVKTLRENIKVIDLRGREGQLTQLLNDISLEGNQFSEPVFLPDEVKKQEFLANNMVGFRVEGELADVWLKILDLIMKFGEVKESEHELKQKEIIDAISVIESFDLKSFLGLKPEEVAKYVDLFFSDKKNEQVEYTYGKRLFKFAFEYVSEQFGVELKFFINQIDSVVKKLKNSPYSRRVVACLWNPFIDLDAKNPPCLTQITWNVKNGRLYQTCIFRSHDLFGAYLLNAMALRELQEKIADQVSLPLGSLIIVSQSAHIYENSLKKTENLLNSHYSAKEVKFAEDEIGYFRIWIENKEIFVQHYLRDGRKTRFEFRGTDPAFIYKRIIQENLISRLDHSAYLGKELTKAKYCIENNQEYVQEGS